MAGPAVPAVVGRSEMDSTWIIGIEDVPLAVKLGFGVLVLDPSDRPRGVMLHEGLPVEGAPPIGTVTAGGSGRAPHRRPSRSQRIRKTEPPFFPDSVLK